MNWTELLSIAREEVTAIIAALPAPLREPAAALPVLYERKPNAALQADGGEPDLLGLFIGPPLADPQESPLPPQIILFLENIWEFSDEDIDIYVDEIQTTYLHELGHYLGLDEIDLEERGLD